jgi:GT2 family glycosyltransferase
MALASRVQLVETHFTPPEGALLSPYETWIEQDALHHPYHPVAEDALVSIVMPTCNTPTSFLQEVIDSVRAQSYSNWELCIADDASTEPHVRQMIDRWAADDHRIRAIYRSERGGISRATNEALSGAKGSIITFLDHDDVLHVDAIGELVKRFAEGDVDVVYTDHDALGEDGVRRFPFFKPDFSLDLLLTQMYIGHLVAFSRALLDTVGGLRERFDGAQDYDLMLRCVAAGARIGHVPKILYHWRQHAGSTSSNADSKPYAHTAGANALQDYLDSVSAGARVDDSPYTFCYDVRYPLGDVEPKASIIIPTRDGVDLLKTCVNSILDKTDYANYEIIVVDNGSVQPETLAWFERRKALGHIRVIDAPVPFNWSHLNNLAAAQADGEVFVFLNNDTEVLDGDWLRRLCENALRPNIGVVGPLLLYPDGTIQHAGVVVGMGGWADHVFKALQPAHMQVLYTSPVMRRNVLAVTGACMVIARDKFVRLGGFDEDFVVCGSDVELCLRAFRQGLLNVYLPEPRLVHHESKTRDPRAIPENDFVLSAKAYSPYREDGDPYFSRNLDHMLPVPSFRSYP